VVGQIGDYFGQEILRYFDRVFDGRKLTILGYSRQRIPGNWKLMQENIKDPYHVGLLHTWFVMFGLIRGDQKSRIIMDEHGRHGAMASTRKATKGGGEVTKGLHSFKQGMKLHDERIIDIKPEPWWNGPTVVMLTLFPNLIVQQQSNSMSTRQIMPRGSGAFDFIWTHFGFEDDDPDMAPVEDRLGACREERVVMHRRAADVQFDLVRLPNNALLGEPGTALPLIELVMDEAIAALCAEAVGVMRRLLTHIISLTNQPLNLLYLLRGRTVIFRPLHNKDRKCHMSVFSHP